MATGGKLELLKLMRVIKSTAVTTSGRGSNFCNHRIKRWERQCCDYCEHGEICCSKAVSTQGRLYIEGNTRKKGTLL